LIFLREYPLENVAVNGGLSSENPKIFETVNETREPLKGVRKEGSK